MKIKITVFFLVSILILSTTQAQNNPPFVKIGTQTWMFKNLDVDHYQNGDPIPEVKDQKEWAKLKTGAWCYYDNNPSNGKIYGKLYNWYAVNDPRGLAPKGWHVPSVMDWTALVEELGGESMAGGKLKESGISHWQSPNYTTTNSGFMGLPGGKRLVGGNFGNIRQHGYWWTSTQEGVTTAWSKALTYMVVRIYGGGSDKQEGYSVRCLKD